MSYNSLTSYPPPESQPVVDTTSSGLWSQIQPEPPVAVDRQHSTSMPETSNLSTTEAAIQDTNFFYPFLEPDRLNMFLDGELLNFNTVDDVGFNLDDFNDYLAGQGLQEDGC